MTIRRAAVAVAVLALLASCGSGDFADTEWVEKDVRAKIDGPGRVKVETVDCPDDQTAEVGKVFTCSYGLADGSSGEIAVTVQSEDGKTTWERTRPASGQAEELIRTGYEKQTGKKVKSVDCPDPLEGGANGRSSCDVELRNGIKGKALLTVTGGKMTYQTN